MVTAVKTRRGYVATPKPVEDEYCECSRCGTIYPTIHYPTNCPGCDKRRTRNDQHFAHNPFEFSMPTIVVPPHPIPN